MQRDALTFLNSWLVSTDRKPLVIRGARQVGKTYLVRAFADQEGRKLIELNFERDPGFSQFFRAKEPAKVLRAIEARFGTRIVEEEALLFLDEIQAAPEVFANLRWFAEEMPRLPVISAGSLLDFMLAQHDFSMPVGRISYLHLEPFSFEEFLSGTGKQVLRDYIEQIGIEAPSPPVHDDLLEQFRDYLLVGGLPAVINRWIDEGSLISCNEAQHALLTTYRDDFNKYSRRTPVQRLNRILDAVPRLLGKKFKYSNVDPEERSYAIRQALDLLCKARLCHRVQACDGSGVPLAAGVRERTFKVILLDVGLVSVALGVTMQAIPSAKELCLINQGAIAEQAVGQALRTIAPSFMEPALYYWTRERKGAAAELDYLLQHGPHVVPVEVKAGTTGSLKSLHLFMADRKLPLAVRFCAQPTSITTVAAKTTTGLNARYRLLSLPFYLVGQTHRLLESAGRSIS